MMRVLDATVPSERAEWERLWGEWPAREVAAHPAYMELFATSNDRILAATLETESGRIFYPFLQRVIPAPSTGGQFTDITTPYGYGGPAFWGKGSPAELAGEFWTAFDKWASHEHIVSEFVRFSLFSGGENWYPGEVVDRQLNVVVPVSGDDDEVWRSFESKVRKNVKRARASGVEVIVDATGTSLDAFMSIYTATMNRRDAADHYYFSRQFFERIHDSLMGQFVYFHAYRDGRVISTELVLVSARSVYSYLGGTHADAFPYRPNDLLKYEIIRWARDHGKQYFVLGGGVAPGDGIERYKRAFAPTGLLGFRTGQRVLLEDAYHGLVESAKKPLSEGFFPAYRA